MLRGALTGALAAVLAAALLWGTCAACRPAVAQKPDTSGCCDQSGRCKTPTEPPLLAQSCPTAALALDRFAPESPLPAAVLEPAALEVTATAEAPAPLNLEADDSPPKLFLRNASFRI
jgi:hypothetical protein